MQQKTINYEFEPKITKNFSVVKVYLIQCMWHYCIINSDKFSLIKSSLTVSKCRASSLPFPLNCDMSCIHSKFVISWEISSYTEKWIQIPGNRLLVSDLKKVSIRYDDLLCQLRFVSSHPKLYWLEWSVVQLLSVASNYYLHWVAPKLFFVHASTWLYGSMINMSVAVKAVSITWNHTWILDSGRPISLAIVSRRKMSG